jgi:hypothetical protein
VCGPDVCRLWKKREAIGYLLLPTAGFHGFIFVPWRAEKTKTPAKWLALGRLLTEVPNKHYTTEYKFVKEKESKRTFLWPGMVPKVTAELPHCTNAAKDFQFGYGRTIWQIGRILICGVETVGGGGLI